MLYVLCVNREVVCQGVIFKVCEPCACVAACSIFGVFTVWWCGSKS